jgi:hypothetical protein
MNVGIGNIINEKNTCKLAKVMSKCSVDDLVKLYLHTTNERERERSLVWKYFNKNESVKLSKSEILALLTLKMHYLSTNEINNLLSNV